MDPVARDRTLLETQSTSEMAVGLSEVCPRAPANPRAPRSPCARFQSGPSWVGPRRGQSVRMRATSQPDQVVAYAPSLGLRLSILRRTRPRTSRLSGERGHWPAPRIEEADSSHTVTADRRDQRVREFAA